MVRAFCPWHMAKTLEELQIYQRAIEAADAVSAVLERPCFRRDRRLRDQIADCADGIPTHISEGYGQRTDRHFSHFLGIARGECNEIRTHFAAARRKKCLQDSEAKELSERYIVIGKMSTNLMKYLDREDRKQRG
jgi:four helix bundle protein